METTKTRENKETRMAGIKIYDKERGRGRGRNGMRLEEEELI